MCAKPTLMLAPIRGVTDAPFRENFNKIFGGFDNAIAPYLQVSKKKFPRDRDIDSILPEASPSLLTVPQVLGNDSSRLAELVNRLVSKGATEVNINLGCPYPMVTRKRMGSGLLPFPDRVALLLDDLSESTNVRLSVKMRIGFESSDEAIPMVEVLNRYPLTSLVIHPRLAWQMYKGKPDLEVFSECLRASQNEVIYNGDIRDVRSFERLKSRFPQISTWMIGRGAIADPFLPSKIVGEYKESDENSSKFMAFHDELYRNYRETLSGPGHVLDKMRGLWAYWTQSIGGKKLFKRIRKAKSLDRYLEAVESIEF